MAFDEFFGFDPKVSEKKKLFKYKKKAARQDEIDRQRQARYRAEDVATVNKEADAARKRRMQSTQEGYKQGEEFFGRTMPGLTPEEKNAMQYEAQRQISSDYQNALQKLQGEQAQRGIVGRGGVGYAQQADLQRQYQDAMGSARRDIDRLNADRALKKQAAIYNVGQSEAAQAELERQAALEDLKYERERREQNALLKKYSKNFSRV